MHIEINKTHSNVISIELNSEKVTQDHIKKIEETVTELKEKTDDIHFIILITKHSKIGLSGIYEVLKMTLKDHKSIHKVAIVADSKLFKIGVEMDNAVLPWQEKYFNIDNLDEAWQWVSNEKK